MKKCAGLGLNGFIFRKINKKYYINEKKRSREPFRICQSNLGGNWLDWLCYLSFSEAHILASTNPQYDKRLFIELLVQYMKIASSEHAQNMLCT
jgi:hypothetical protein